MTPRPLYYTLSFEGPVFPFLVPSAEITLHQMLLNILFIFFIVLPRVFS